MIGVRLRSPVCHQKQFTHECVSYVQPIVQTAWRGLAQAVLEFQYPSIEKDSWWLTYPGRTNEPLVNGITKTNALENERKILLRNIDIKNRS